jgi:hypothetical protein
MNMLADEVTIARMARMLRSLPQLNGRKAVRINHYYQDEELFVEPVERLNRLDARAVQIETTRRAMEEEYRHKPDVGEIVVGLFFAFVFLPLMLYVIGVASLI